MSGIVAHNLSGFYCRWETTNETDNMVTGDQAHEIQRSLWDWPQDRLTQEKAALILGVSDSTFCRYIDRYEEGSLEEIADKRLTQASHHRTPVDEVMALVDLYSSHHIGWNVRHFHDWYINPCLTPTKITPANSAC